MAYVQFNPHADTISEGLGITNERYREIVKQCGDGLIEFMNRESSGTAGDLLKTMNKIPQTPEESLLVGKIYQSALDFIIEKNNSLYRPTILQSIASVLCTMIIYYSILLPTFLPRSLKYITYTPEMSESMLWYSIYHAIVGVGLLSLFFVFIHNNITRWIFKKFFSIKI